MTSVRSRIEVAAAAIIVTGGLFAMGLIVYASWISFLSYFRYSGRDPDGLASVGFDLYMIVMFVLIQLFPYRVVRLFVTSWSDAQKARRSTLS